MHCSQNSYFRVDPSSPYSTFQIDFELVAISLAVIGWCFDGDGQAVRNRSVESQRRSQGLARSKTGSGEADHIRPLRTAGNLRWLTDPAFPADGFHGDGARHRNELDSPGTDLDLQFEVGDRIGRSGVLDRQPSGPRPPWITRESDLEICCRSLIGKRGGYLLDCQSRRI